MKYRNVALFFFIVSLFLIMAPYHAVTEPAATTAILAISEIPTVE